jgi:hypothetical protein
MIFSVIDEHDEQQLINVLHVARVSCSKGANRACIHLANGQFVKTIHSIGEVSTQIDGIFKRTCQWLRYLSLISGELDEEAITRSEAIHQESLQFPNSEEEESDLTCICTGQGTEHHSCPVHNRPEVHRAIAATLIDNAINNDGWQKP